ncbi:MAG: TonB-dependent receptor plug domain-containing protein, partial [Balneolales bacterium]|nr:TonB-dependent receptor plug domain-containing protein [Balneolales bacterium]
MVGKFWVFLFALPLFPQFLVGQESQILRVFVQDDELKPLTGAYVLLYRPGEEDFSHYCISDANGFCEIRGLTEPSYLLSVSYIGFEKVEEEIEISVPIVLRTITMEIENSELDEVIISAEREITVGRVGISRVTVDDLSRMPSMNIDGDLMAYIQTVPGVITVGDQGGDLYIRGGTPAQNLVLIDNIPIVKPFHISNLFSALPEQVVNSIDIMAGGFDNKYMGSTSAVIDANLKPGNFRSYSSSVSFSPYITSVFLEGPIRKDTRSLMLSGRYSTIDQFSGYLGTDEENINFYDVIGRYSIKGDGFNCSFTGIFTNDRGQINEARANFLEWSNTAIGGKCLGYDERFDHPYEVSVGHSRFTNSEGTEDEIERESSVINTYMRFDMQEYFRGLRIDYGLNILAQSFSANLNERFTIEQEIDRTIPIFQLYGKTEWKVNDFVTLQPGLGFQVTTLYAPTVEPRLRFLYTPYANNDLQISVAAGVYNQIFDGITDERDAGTTFTVYRPNDIGEPLPSAIHGIFGVQNKFGRYWSANIEFYYKYHQNIPVSRWEPIAQLEIETALAESDNYGFDASVRYQSPKTFIYLGYGWSLSEYSVGIEDVGAWTSGDIFRYNPPHDQRHKLNTTMSFEFLSITASANWELGSGLPYTQVIGFDLYLPTSFYPTEFAGLAR